MLAETRLSRIGIARPLMAAILCLGFAASAEAAAPDYPGTYKKICAGSLCMLKGSLLIWDGSVPYYLSFRGSAVSHYNVRYVEIGGREVQIELKAASGSNLSKVSHLKGTPGGKFTIHVQACNRSSFGPFSSKSSCTQWHKITFNMPEKKM
jgi:hypothetical protein